MATTKGLYTTNRTYVGMLRGTYATVEYAIPTYVSDPAFRFNSLLLTGETDYLPFNADNSLNNLNVTVVGDARASNFNPYTPGYYSAYFDGSGDYLTLPDNAGWVMNTDYTIEFWFYASSLPGQYNNIINQYGGSSSYWGINYDTSLGWCFFYHNGAGEQKTARNQNSPLNNWVHIAVVKSGTTGYMFINGTQAGATFSYPTINDVSSSLYIGAWSTPGDYINGYLSNLRVVKGTALYTSNFTPSTTPLTAVSGTQLLTCQDNRFVDRSTNNFTITKNGDTRIDPADPFELPASYTTYGSTYMDGTGDYLNSTYAINWSTFGSYTIEFWVYHTSMSATNQTYASTGGSGYTNFYNYSNGRIGLGIQGTNEIVSASGVITTNTWYHIAYTYNGTTTTIYVNGVSVASGTTGVYSNNSAALQIGNGLGGLPVYGYMSDFRLTKGTVVYTGNFTPPTAPVSIAGSTSQYAVTANVNTTFPSANTSLSLLQTSQPHNNNAFLDKSNFRQLITRAGNPYSGTFSPYGSNWSGYFDGSAYIITASSTAFGFGTGDYTVEFWYFSADDSYSYPWDFRVGGGGSGQTKPLMSISATDTILYIGTTTVISAAGIPQRTWGHIAVVRQTGVTRIYINGVLSGTPYTGSQDFGSTNTLSLSTVGDSPGYSTTELVGNMSNFRVVKGAAVYTGNFTPSTVPLTTTVTAGANVTAITSANVSYLGLNSYNLADTSINKISQTITGTVVAQTFSPFGRTANVSPEITGGSAYFDSNGDYIGSPQSAIYNLSIGNWTIEAWYYSFSDLSQSARYMTFIPSSGATYGVLPGNNAFILNQFGTSSPISTSIPSTLYRWQHIALVKSGSTTTLYINGIAGGSGTVSWVDAPTTIYVGGNPGTYAYYFSGYVSDFRFVRNAVYTGNFTPPSLPLTLSGNSLIYSNTTNVNTTFSVANTAAMLNFTDGAIKDATMYIDAESVGDAKLGFETAYSGSYYSNYFDGAGDYLSVPASSALSFDADFTIECWVNTSTISLDPYGRRLWSFGSGSAFYLDAMFYDGSGITSSLCIQIPNTGVVITGTIPVANSQWNHVALTRAGSSMKLFVNGVQSGSTYTTSSSFTAGASNGMFLGCLGAGVGGFLLGNISNFRVVKGTALYTAAFTPPTEPLTAVSGTSLLTCQSNRFRDNSTNNFAITVTGQTAVRTFNPFRRNPGSSLFFDGSGDYLQIASSTQEVIGGANATVEFWMYPIQTDGYRRIVTSTSGGFGGGTFCIRFSAGNFAAGALGGNGITAAIPAANTWTHVAWVGSNNGSTQTLYLNGNVAGTSTSYNLTEAIQFVGGYYTSGPSEFFYGYLDDVRVTKGNVRYTANFTPSIGMLQVR